MVITEVRIKLMINNSDNKRLQAYCSVTFDNAIVVHDLKIIKGIDGWFVAFPSRKLTDHCPKCSARNHLKARFCNQCGDKLDENRAACNGEGHSKLYADVVHPVSPADCLLIQTAIFRAFSEKCERVQQPGYVGTCDHYNTERDDCPRDLLHQPATGMYERTPAFGAGILD